MADGDGTGLFELAGLAATLALALPLALFGASELLDGRPLGAAFVALAVLLLAVERYLVTPGDLPGRIAARVLGRVAEEPADTGEE